MFLIILGLGLSKTSARNLLTVYTSGSSGIRKINNIIRAHSDNLIKKERSKINKRRAE